MISVAILDDYQQVALQLADWHRLDPDAEIKVFPDHLADPRRFGEAAASLRYAWC